MKITMETKVALIRTEEPFKRKWSEATTIISDAELARVEGHVINNVTDYIDGDRSADHERLVEVVKRLTPAMPDIVIHRDSRDLQGHVTLSKAQSKGQILGHSSEVISNSTKSNSQEVTSNGHVFKTPQKIHSEFVQRLQSLHQERHKRLSPVLGEQSDWMIAERSNSRSPPSPAIDVTARSPHVQPSPSVQGQGQVFSFSPEITESYRQELDREMESRRVKKRLFDDMSQASPMRPRDPPSPSYLTGRLSPSERHYLPSPRILTSSRDRMSLSERDAEVPYYVTSPSPASSMGYFGERESFRAKRRIDMDEDYVSTPKRLKSEFEREMSYRYIQQLDSDIASIRNKLYTAEKEIAKPSNCTCAIMERQFLEMAESAYRSVRRIDGSPRGFEQFRRELIQTNEVMKDSMDVLKSIRSFCEHKVTK